MASAASARSASDATTALFVPGDRPELLGKAAASGADVVIIDLEDAVAHDAKEIARRHAIRALSDATEIGGAVVRINAFDEGGVRDAEALAPLAGADGLLRAIMVPKAGDAEHVAALHSIVGADAAIIPLVETVVGLQHVAQLASAPGVIRLAFGALDFVADVGASGDVLLDHARCEIVLASRGAGIAAPLDSPSPEFRDLGVVRQQAHRSRALGFGGQLCIHPSQVPVVAEAFRPSAEELDWAARIVASSDDGVTQLDGSMIDRPVVLRARAILRRGRLSETA